MKSIIFYFFKCIFVFFVLFLVGLIIQFVISTIQFDLDRYDGGYLRSIFYYFSSIRAEILQICEKPLTSLSISNIAQLCGYVYIFFIFLWLGWALITGTLEYYREKQNEEMNLYNYGE